MAATKIWGSRQIADASILNAQQAFGTPSADTDVATKGYVDSVAQGLSAKPSALVATVAALSPTNTYTAGVLTATGVGTLTVDGVVTALNDYVLVKDEASQLKNGLYKVTTAGAGGVPYVLTRAVEMNVSAEFTGAFVFVESGTVNVASGWVQTAVAPTVGTTAIVFVQFSGAGSITAGNGLSKSGNTLSIDTSITVDKTTAQTLTSKTLTAPVINAGSATGLTGLSISQPLSGFNLGLEANGSDLSANRSLYLVVNNVDRTINLSGNLTLGGAFVTSGASSLTLTTTGATNVTVPTTGTLATLAGAESLTNKKLGSVSNGIIKATSGDGTLAVAVNSDLPAMTATVGGAVPTPPNNTTTFLRGDGTFAIPGASTVYHRSTAVSGTQDSANKIFTIANTVSTGSEQVYLNGQLLMPGASNDYVYNGTTTVTFQAGFTAPASTDVIRVYGTY